MVAAVKTQTWSVTLSKNWKKKQENINIPTTFLSFTGDKYKHVREDAILNFQPVNSKLSVFFSQSLVLF